MSILDDSIALKIKERLWFGETAKSISEDPAIQVNLQTIVNIRGGFRWAHIAWPNGATGSMPEARDRLISKARTEASRHMPAIVRAILLKGSRSKSKA